MSKWKVIDEGNDVERPVDSRAEAEETVEELKEIVESAGGNPDNIKVQSPKGEERANITADGNVVQQGGKADGGTEVVDPTPDEAPPENIESDTDGYDLPDDGPSVDEDPLVWMPDEFTDQIDGSVAINRKGFEVLAHHYDIQCSTDVCESLTTPDRVVFKAVATDADGDTYSAFGSACEARGDDTGLLIEMADTRAYKRAISRATGVGMVAVSELQNEL
jgi:hypothetical protein